MDISRRAFGASLLGGMAFRALALPPRPQLSVLIVLQQFCSNYLDIGWGDFGTGGFRRLIEQGTFFPDCRHLASSFTASSLATLATGAWPAQHGIVADTWYDRASGRPVRPSEEDLRATTLAAQFTEAGGSRLFAVSLDRAEAALFAGTPAAWLYWMDDEGGFAANAPNAAWVSEYNRTKPVESLHNAPWLALGAPADAPPLRTLTYEEARPHEFVQLYKASPFAQAAQFAITQELIARERIGQTNTFDFVMLLLGSTALLGYETGSVSPLMQQMTLHLDRQLEAFLNQLDRTVGAGQYNLVIAGGHGAPPAPAAESRPRMAVNGELLAQAIQQRLEQGGNGHIARYLYPFLYLDVEGYAAPELTRRAAGRAALEQPAVAAYYTADGECSIHDDWENRFRNSFYPGRSGDVMLSYRPEYVEDYGAGRGVSYGSLYNYDIRVPLCFYGPQFRPRLVEHPVQAIDVAPTLARASGMPVPSSSLGRVLGEAFAGDDLAAETGPPPVSR
ncbi:MAG TPA: alkaline phosphatase family protein [Bryobacteraceae bacterium]|nr:alkaline phosphatase family protein [Bryobacteraceae bacterium]